MAVTMDNYRLMEQKRQSLQDRLDGEKTPKERNRCGQFPTPPLLAQDIAQVVRQLWRENPKPIHFGEPSVGTGALFSALLHACEPGEIATATGYEVDGALAKAAHDLWATFGLNVVHDDFVQGMAGNGTELRPNVIIANPPYIRHHHLDQEQKARIQALTNRITGISVNGLAGLYVYFVLIAHGWLQDEGLAAWLIPSEFMDVNYGSALRDYLTRHVTLLVLHRFDPEDAQFADALVSSAVVIFRKCPPAPNAQAIFSYGGTVTTPKTTQSVAISELRTQRKWTEYPAKDTDRSKENNASDGPSLSDLFRITRGIVTGANDFFILRRETARARRFPESALRPILPSPRYLKAEVIEAGTDGYPCLEPQLVVIDSDLPEYELKQKHPTLAAYLNEGKERGLMDRYLLRKRQPWYKQEAREPAPFLCTYMGRSAEGNSPFRFFWNRSSAVAPNVYLMLYPTASLKKMLLRRPECAIDILRLLQQITGAALKREGRVYGGGLHKIEPKELGRLPADAFVDRFPELGSSQPRQLDLLFG